MVDNGILPNHKEFMQTGTSRVRRPNMNAYLQQNGQSTPGADCWTLSPPAVHPNASHGTSVASVAGGNVYGVAKRASLVDVRVFGCGGDAPASRVATALEWILTDPDRSNQPRVVNLSFEYYNYGPYASELSLIRQAVGNLINAGMTVIAAAGNANENAYFYTPAGSGPIAVGAYEKGANIKWARSNYGSGVMLYAPGQYIESASLSVTEVGFAADTPRSGLDDCANFFDTCTSGTSFAAPYVAGIAARFLEINSWANQSDVLAALENEAYANHGLTIYEEPVQTHKPIAGWIDCQ